MRILLTGDSVAAQSCRPPTPKHSLSQERCSCHSSPFFVTTHPSWGPSPACHVCTGTGLTPATSATGLGSPCTTSAPGLGLPLPHLHRGLGSPLPHLHRGLGSPLPHLHRDWAHPCHICTGTGLTPATSAPESGSPLPHRQRDWAHPCQLCPGTRSAAAAPRRSCDGVLCMVGCATHSMAWRGTAGGGTG